MQRNTFEIVKIGYLSKRELKEDGEEINNFSLHISGLFDLFKRIHITSYNKNSMSHKTK